MCLLNLSLYRGLCVLTLKQVLGYGAYNLFLHPLRFYPGPKLWAAYHLPWMRSVLSGRYPFEALELHKKYGSVVRVAPNELSYTDSAAWKAICGDHNSVTEGFFEMGKDFRNFHRPVNGVLSMIAADTTTHARFRRLFSHSFSEKGLRDMQPRIRRYVDLLIQGLRKNCDEGHLDIVEWYNWTAFDLVGDLAFGESFDCLQNQKTNDWVSAIFGNVKAAACLSALERYGLKRLVPLIVPKRLIEFRELNARRNAEQIDRRIELGTGRGDFWDEVLAKSDFEKGSGMTRAEMVSNAGLLVLAGSETTATLLSGTTYLLLKHPLVMRKLVNEVRGAFKSEDEIDLVSVNKLNYMLAVLDESMRIYPPVPHQGNRIVPVPGAMICGKWVPPRVSQHGPSTTSFITDISRRTSLFNVTL